MLCRCFETCCLVDFTSLLINKSMNTTRGRTIVVRNLHDDFVILTTRFDHKLVGWCLVATDRTMIARLEVIFKCITQHQCILTNIDSNGVAGVLGGTVVSEGLGGHVRLVDVNSIGRIRQYGCRLVPLRQLAHGRWCSDGSDLQTASRHPQSRSRCDCAGDPCPWQWYTCHTCGSTRWGAGEHQQCRSRSCSRSA